MGKKQTNQSEKWNFILASIEQCWLDIRTQCWRRVRVGRHFEIAWWRRTWAEFAVALRPQLHTSAHTTNWRHAPTTVSSEVSRLVRIQCFSVRSLFNWIQVLFLPWVRVAMTGGRAWTTRSPSRSRTCRAPWSATRSRAKWPDWPPPPPAAPVSTDDPSRHYNQQTSSY